MSTNTKSLDPMSTEAQMIANQSAYIEPTEDQLKILEAKKLLGSAFTYIQPHTDPFENDEGYKEYQLIRKIQEFLDHA